MSETRKRLKLEAPRLPAELERLSLPARLGTRDAFEHGLVEGERLEELDADKVVFDGVVFRGVTFDSAKLRSLELTDVLFDRCDLSNADLSRAVVHRAQFRSCKLVGADLSEAMLRNVLVEDCQLDYANLRAADLKGVVFADSSLNRADFCMAKLAKTEFHRCKLDGALLGTPLRGIDLSDSEFTGLSCNPDDLRGCIISREQAFIFAALFGMVLKD
ncbi:pentapeptide repeat-containing protein [Paenibacillus pasadenensis]|uniref:pentapeptide repeat-containing protein n=1 Tax=Paenibacillus pasadenensis TaxID=217090 RepID=UPI0003F5B378|nr:pentapeptide repeat-containing protein [Paenibacillus pasadenensis]